MRNTYYDQPHSSPPIFPAGSNGIEARVKAIEVHLWHQARDNQQQGHDISEAHGRISSLDASINQLVRKVGIWLIGALGTATMALLLIVVKLLFPGIFQ